MDDMTGPLTSPAEKKMESMPQAEACGSPCLKLTTLENGVKVSCIYYIAKAVLVIVLPIMFSMNGRANGWGGADGRTEAACQFLKGCPDFGTGPEARHKMWELMYDADECTKNGGTPIEVEESLNDHSMGDTEIWFSIRAATIVFAAIGAGLNLRAMLNGSNEYLAPLARSLIVLVFFEIIAEIFAHNAIDDRCEDSEVREALSCAETQQTASTLGGSQEINLSNPAMQCEDHRVKMDAGFFVLGVLLNFYICWIVHSYEKSVRGGAAMLSSASMSDESPA